MKRFSFLLTLLAGLILSLALASACGTGSSSSSSSNAIDDDGSPDDDDNDDASPDDDDDASPDDDDDASPDDDTSPGDDDASPPPPVTNDARAEGFKLYYRERMLRILTAWNRFGLADDAVPGTNIGQHLIAKTGNAFEVQAGEQDNNDIGKSVWSTWFARQIYAAIGDVPHAVDLSLIRMFEGLAFYEAITGHAGLTSREVLPGWTRVMDGVHGTVARTRSGQPFTPPVTFSAALEQDVLNTFYSGLVFTYREEPLEYYYSLKPIADTGDFAVTYVFSVPGDFMRESDCCSSWMISKEGIWTGAYWGNHNSRDNFPDMSLGYLAAFQAATMNSLPADLATAAARAAAAGHRIGDCIVAYNDVQMTVPETGNYDTLVPGGQVGPDGGTSWQDLGSLDSCQDVYLAKALTTDGLHEPVPQMPMPGGIERSALAYLLKELGFPDPQLPMEYCHSLDDAMLGLTWGEVMNFKLFGQPWYQVAEDIANLDPDLFPKLLGSTADDFKELELGAMANCYYAAISNQADLLDDARNTLANLVDLHRILAKLAYSAAKSPRRTLDQRLFDKLVRDYQSELFYAAVMASLFGIETPPSDFDNFAPAESENENLENILSLNDTTPWPLITDDQIQQQVQNALNGADIPAVVTRYQDRFPDGPPVRTAGDGYEAIGADGNWRPAENPHHAWFNANHLLFELPLCVNAPWTISPDWAVLGCERADLDNTGTVGAADLATFNAAWTQYQGVACDAGNNWCGGADLNRDGVADQNDKDFMAAAQGCIR